MSLLSDPEDENSGGEIVHARVIIDGYTLVNMMIKQDLDGRYRWWMEGDPLKNSGHAETEAQAMAQADAFMQGFIVGYDMAMARTERYARGRKARRLQLFPST